MTWRQMIGVGVRRVVLAACARSRPCRLREESSIDSRGQNMGGGTDGGGHPHPDAVGI